jgi:hypothetical protein
VKQVVKVRVLPNEPQAASLAATLRSCNEAAAWLSAAMHAQQVRRKHDVQKRFYAELKQRFGLSAQPDRQGRRGLCRAESEHRRRQPRPTRV